MRIAGYAILGCCACVTSGLKIVGHSKRDVRCAACTAFAHALAVQTAGGAKSAYETLEAACARMEKYRSATTDGQLLFFQLLGDEDVQLTSPDGTSFEGTEKSEPTPGLRAFCDDLVLKHEDALLGILGDEVELRRPVCVSATKICTEAQVTSLPPVHELSPQEQAKEVLDRILPGLKEKKKKEKAKQPPKDVSKHTDWKWTAIASTMLAGVIASWCHCR